ncbi:MAG: peptide-methionine (S)-S-oxide reductase MsrA [Parcubacteria group bacterium]|nr:peptide-methionine (S)-S-oxide reductase MsrA [Parcubacteria group bacterium]
MARISEIALFGGGCFWCTEAIYNELKGVTSVTSGYSGGAKANPSYEEVSSGTTGHAEVIKIEFDPSVISYRDLLSVFFSSHDPTTMNRQGNDVGEQYRSAIFYTSPEQKRAAEECIAELGKDGVFEKPIVTKVEPFNAFYPAEKYHERYYERNRTAPYCQLVINPKLKKLKERHAALLKEV